MKIIFRSSSGECSVTAFKNASARFGSYDKNARCAQSKIHNYGISHLYSKTLRYVALGYGALRCAGFADTLYWIQTFSRYTDHRKENAQSRHLKAHQQNLDHMTRMLIVDNAKFIIMEFQTCTARP